MFLTTRFAEVALDADGAFRPDFGGASTWRVAAPALVVIEDVGGTGGPPTSRDDDDDVPRTDLVSEPLESNRRDDVGGTGPRALRFNSAATGFVVSGRLLLHPDPAAPAAAPGGGRASAAARGSEQSSEAHEAEDEDGHAPPAAALLGRGFGADADGAMMRGAASLLLGRGGRI